MGQTCCRYQPKDENTQNFVSNKIQLVPENPEMLRAYAVGKKNEVLVVKMQAFVRGYLVRKASVLRKKKRQISELEWKIICYKKLVKGKFPGCTPFAKRRKLPLDRENLKTLDKMPDYTNKETKLTKQKLGYFQNNLDNVVFGPVHKRGPTEVEDGAVYHGQWNDNGMRHGIGLQVWPDGMEYEGYWANDMANYRGRLIMPNGDSYEGEWLLDKANGQGTYKYAQGASYVGEWMEDKIHGYGIETWPQNFTYKGNFERGLKEGLGNFEWPDSSKYFGEFKRNNINGQGTYIQSNGMKYEGNWRKNQVHGVATFTGRDGRKYIGEYENNKKCGYGVFQWPDGSCYKGYWRDDKQHGRGILVNQDGVGIVTKWNMGKIELRDRRLENV